MKPWRLPGSSPPATWRVRTGEVITTSWAFAVSRALYHHGRAVIAVAVLMTLVGVAIMIGSEAYRDVVGFSLFGGFVLVALRASQFDCIVARVAARGT
ncbi:MAG TPA: hypothetical protein VGB74_20355 [Actinoplanes sp.]